MREGLDLSDRSPAHYLSRYHDNHRPAENQVDKTVHICYTGNSGDMLGSPLIQQKPSRSRKDALVAYCASSTLTMPSTATAPTRAINGAETHCAHRWFPYVEDSSPAELPANLERALSSIAPPSDDTLMLSGNSMRKLCIALDKFVGLTPSLEKSVAFYDAYKSLFGFLSTADRNLSRASSCSGEKTLEEAINSPAGELAGTLFRVSRDGDGSEECRNEKLLECLTASLETLAGKDGYCHARGTLLSASAPYAVYLYALDSDWTTRYLLSELASGSQYRKNVANGLIYSRQWLPDGFLVAVRPYLLDLMPKLEGWCDNHNEISRAVSWFIQIAFKALEDGDGKTCEQVTAALMHMPDEIRGQCVLGLRYFFNEEELSPKEASRFQKLASEFMSDLYPREAWLKSEWNTLCLTELILYSGDIGIEIYESVKQLLVPIKDIRFQSRIPWKLKNGERASKMLKDHPEVILDMMGRVADMDMCWQEDFKQILATVEESV